MHKSLKIQENLSQANLNLDVGLPSVLDKASVLS